MDRHENPDPAIHGMPADDAERLRAAGGEVQRVTSCPGWPCRQCLRDIEVGDEALLVSYDPFPAGTRSPYRTPSPVFLHRRTCGTPAPLRAAPPQLTARLLSVRAFDETGRMVAAEVLDGVAVDGALARSFADAATAYVHVHNAGPGCFAARVTRAGG